MIEEIIKTLVENPTDENRERYLKYVNQTEYSLLLEAENFPFKSQEYFNKRSEAFSYRGKCAAKLLRSWVPAHGSTEGCPASYADTLNIPFRQISVPNDEVF
jgi:hypothetical protein